MIRIEVMSVMVNDQEKAHDFYTGILGFQVRHNVDVGGAAWLTVVSPADPDGPEVLLEPDWNPQIEIEGKPAAQVFKQVLYDAGIPFTSFGTDDIHGEFERMKELGVEFKMEPTDAGPVTVAIFDDTCGNLIQLHQPG
ncbi:MAG: VOC family protein [Sphaerobacteraceae bacterium]|nr:MAG: VOC family protein [Sphaerobacteraceae bacterium]